MASTSAVMVATRHTRPDARHPEEKEERKTGSACTGVAPLCPHPHLTEVINAGRGYFLDEDRDVGVCTPTAARAWSPLSQALDGPFPGQVSSICTDPGTAFRPFDRLSFASFGTPTKRTVPPSLSTLALATAFLNNNEHPVHKLFPQYASAGAPDPPDIAPTRRFG